jgi:hypothetical protein
VEEARQQCRRLTGQSTRTSYRRASPACCPPVISDVSSHMRRLGTIGLATVLTTSVEAQIAYPPPNSSPDVSVTVPLRTSVPTRCVALLGSPGQPIVILDLQQLEKRASSSPKWVAAEIEGLRQLSEGSPAVLSCSSVTSAKAGRLVDFFAGALESGEAAVILDPASTPIESVIVRFINGPVGGHTLYYVRGVPTPFLGRERWIR